MLSEEEQKHLRQVHRLNYFYAFTVVTMTLVALYLLFSFSLQQRQLLNEMSEIVETRVEENAQLQEEGQRRLEEAIARLDEVEQTLLDRLPEDRLVNLEDNIIELLDELIAEHESLSDEINSQ